MGAFINPIMTDLRLEEFQVEANECVIFSLGNERRSEIRPRTSLGLSDAVTKWWFSHDTNVNMKNSHRSCDDQDIMMQLAKHIYAKAAEWLLF